MINNDGEKYISKNLGIAMALSHSNNTKNIHIICTWTGNTSRSDK